MGCVKSCGRLPDCSVLSPPELALEVIWWNVAFCLLLLDLLLQKKENAVLLRLLGKEAGMLQELSLDASSSSQALLELIKLTLFGKFPDRNLQTISIHNQSIKPLPQNRNSALPASCSHGWKKGPMLSVQYIWIGTSAIAASSRIKNTPTSRSWICADR